jgi:two-component system sensor histidine kinase AlgZ
MMNQTRAPMPSTVESPITVPLYKGILLRAAAITSGAAALIIVLCLSIGRYRISQVGRESISAFIYCAFIAVPSIFLLTFISHRYTDRFPRLIFLMQAAIQAFTATTGSLMAGVVLVLIGFTPWSGYWREFWQSAPFSVVIAMAFGLSLSTIETMRFKLQHAKLELRTQQVEQERAYKLLAEARLSALESRIHPHFLFNTLNSIAALIPSDPVRAEDTVGKLASLLRFSLNARESGLVPLGLELKIVRDYLEIERTRFGARIRYTIAVPENLETVKVPPLALQSLVENCVKHVVAHRQEGAQIQIAGTRTGGQVSLEVLDDGPGFSLESITPEHGLGNLIGRLELLYGPAGKLEVDRKNNQTAVRISFPG